VAKLGRKIAAGLLGFCLALGAAPAGAIGPGDSSSPEAIQEKLDRLRVFYTEDHPEVLRLKEHLRKARDMEARKKALERAADPKQRPAIDKDFSEQESFR